MIPIKIQCGCGQKYAFDAETVDGKVTSPVACPACGADGTTAANAVVALQAPSATTEAQARPAARHAAQQLAKQVDLTQAVYEARARISWGDPPLEVTAYLMTQGFSRAEAIRLVQETFSERMAAIRINGIKRIAAGIGLILIPAILFPLVLSIDYKSGPPTRGRGFITILTLAAAAGLFGIWLLIQGIFMVVSPKSESGDLTEQ